MPRFGIILLKRKKGDIHEVYYFGRMQRGEKKLEDLRDSSSLNLDGQNKLEKAIELLQRIVTHLEEGVALELPEKAEK
jgi:hypothetical protein